VNERGEVAGINAVQQYSRAFFREFQMKPIAPKGTGGDAKILLRCMPLGLSPAYM
jgi:hypothetical protein